MQATQVLKEEINFFAGIERRGFEKMSDKIGQLAESQKRSYEELLTELSAIGDILEWGFGEISWQLEQQTEILRRIVIGIMHPRQVEALELREMAEKHWSKGCLSESKKCFLESLKLCSLDYRTYIGLAKVCLEMNNINEALLYFEKSLPHAHALGNDYESYTYRLIGRAYYSKEEYSHAVHALKMATIISPDSYVAFYDLAKYSAKTGEKETCLESLERVIKHSAFYFDLAEKEDFSPISVEVQNFLQGIKNWALQEIGAIILKTERMIELARIARKSVKAAEEVLDLNNPGYIDRSGVLNSINTKIDRAEKGFKFYRSIPKDKKDRIFVVSPEGEVFVQDFDWSHLDWSYQRILGEPLVIKEIYDLAERAKEYADYAITCYEKRKGKALGVFFGRIISSILLSLILGFIVGNMAGCAIGVLSNRVSVRGGMNVCFWVVFILALVITLGDSISSFAQEKRGEYAHTIFADIRDFLR
ncbi:MAG: hypothetical protein WC650_04470 [Candidatus Doudnabacteria bacterium]